MGAVPTPLQISQELFAIFLLHTVSVIETDVSVRLGVGNRPRAED